MSYNRYSIIQIKTLLASSISDESNQMSLKNEAVKKL